jgi:hypothetical protein
VPADAQGENRQEAFLNLDPLLPAPVKVTREGVAQDALNLFTRASK